MSGSKITVFHTVLVANRGEIACRILRSVHALGYRSAVMRTPADTGAPHGALADCVIELPRSEVDASYLDITTVIGAARRAGADAIHPGYGFLSENAEFARACTDAGLLFIGPPADAIEAMGDKARSKLRMRAAGVPCIPGYDGEAQDDESLRQAALTLGFPLMVKACAGGGGRGMRRVEHVDALGEALASARNEARHAFGSSALLLERAIDRGRHVEIQILADRHGQVLHLGERDCSLQRRHQKVIEEAPSPAVGEELRARMGAAAIAAARAVGYVGAGTVEFMLTEDGEFYFLEMNTRLQVEHPVTECITGWDLVEWQLRIAAGSHLPEQSAVRLTGHAVEARLYAEDPARNFLPQTGEVLRWKAPQGSGVRVDAGIQAGQAITPHYDPMLAKIIAHGQTRAEALRRLDRALAETVLLGVRHNGDFLRALLAAPEFAQARADTGFIERALANGEFARETTNPLMCLLAAALWLEQEDRSGSPGLSAMTLPPFEFRLRDESGEATGVVLRALGHGRYADAQDNMLSLHTEDRRVTHYRWQGITRRLDYASVREHLWVCVEGRSHHFVDERRRPPAPASASGEGLLRAPMAGCVTDIRTAVGMRVRQGEVLLTLEAMKMEHGLRADRDGEILAVLVSSGAQVDTHALLIRIGDPVES